MVTSGVQSILVATDFSPDSAAAFKQAIWLAHESGAKTVLAHTRRDLRNAMHESSYETRLDLLYGKGDLFQKELRKASDEKLKKMIADVGEKDLDIEFETLLGEPFVQLTHAVQSQHHDIVMMGTRGLSSWQQFLIGSTAKKLIRCCPADVWIVKSTAQIPPKVVLAAIDFSSASLKAAAKAYWIARHANATFRLLHVIDSTDIPEDNTSLILRGGPLEQEIVTDARKRLESVQATLQLDTLHVETLLAWGAPWQEIERIAKQIGADLIALGTVGRTGISGILLGNTAEKILDRCASSVLVAKPDDFVSPVDPNFWPLIPSPNTPQT